MIYYIWQLFTCVAFCIVRIKHFFVFFLIWFKILVYSWNKKIKTIRKYSIKGREFQAQFAKKLYYEVVINNSCQQNLRRIYDFWGKYFYVKWLYDVFKIKVIMTRHFFPMAFDEWIVYEPLVNDGLWYSS